MRQRCVYIGNRLDLTYAEWLKALHNANESKQRGFPPLTIRDFFLTAQKYVEKRALPFSTMAGIKEAMKFVVRRGPYYAVLGLKIGSTAAEIQTAFRALSRVHHPDVGGDPIRFREIVAARDLLISGASR